MKKLCIVLLILVFVTVTAGCGEWSRTAKGGAIGAGAGGAVGAAIGYASGATVAGLLIGAAVGGATGAFIGNYMDKQAAEIERDIQGAKVERIGEGIKITFSSGILFDVNKDNLQPQYQSELSELAIILNKYDDTHILLAGHTDSTGSAELNLDLSRRRAESVASYLRTQNIAAERFTAYGYGQDYPVSSNETEAGRAQNRRVEVAIWANDKLKKVAADQARS